MSAFSPLSAYLWSPHGCMPPRWGIEEISINLTQERGFLELIPKNTGISRQNQGWEADSSLQSWSQGPQCSQDWRELIIPSPGPHLIADSLRAERLTLKFTRLPSWTLKGTDQPWFQIHSREIFFGQNLVKRTKSDINKVPQPLVRIWMGGGRESVRIRGVAVDLTDLLRLKEQTSLLFCWKIVVAGDNWLSAEP